MNMLPNAIEVATLLGDKSRATILFTLLDGRMVPASELARHAHISPQTASSHLSKLVEGGLLSIEAEGRHRYYKLASQEVAKVLEGMLVIAPPKPIRSLRESEESRKLRYARTCYDHLAGRVGVALTRRLISLQVIDQSDFSITPYGKDFLTSWGIPQQSFMTRKRIPCRQCLDWSERHYHLAGSIAKEITNRLFELSWIHRLPNTRAVEITQTGKKGFIEVFGCSEEDFC